MSETVTGVFGDYLKTGLAVSVQGRPGEQVAAIVEKLSLDSIWLKLPSRSSDPAFTQGDKIQINYWDEGATIYSSVASVLEIDGANPKRLGLSVSEEVQIQRRKSYRARARVPFSFTVIEAAASDLVGDRIMKSLTENITTGGLLDFLRSYYE
jgi:hypothetical protein